MKPLLFLDIDGVLNCFPSPLHTQLMETQEWRDGDAVTGDRMYRLWWRESVIARINSWHDRDLAEIVWLTTWTYDAASSVAPLMGLKDFLVVGDEKGSENPRDLDWWKWDRVKEIVASSTHPFVWLDDDLYGPVATEAAERYGHQMLAIAPPSNPGLTDEMLDEVEEFLLFYASE